MIRKPIVNIYKPKNLYTVVTYEGRPMLIFSDSKTSFGDLSKSHGSSCVHQTTPKEIVRIPIKKIGIHVKL